MKGYFERTDVIKLNALLLDSQQCNWHKGLDHFDQSKWRSDVTNDFLPRSSKIVQKVAKTTKKNSYPKARFYH